MDNNLLRRLHTYASMQDENFTTESFVHLLKYLRQHEYSSFATLGRKITGGIIDFDLCNPDDITILTQVSTDEGRPDIEISGPNFIIFIEVKVDSSLGDRQLERYREAISTYDKEKTMLILLSRVPYEVDNEILDSNLRWFQIGDWLADEVKKGGVEDTAQHLINQFAEFLQYRNLMFSPPRSRVSEFLKYYLDHEKGRSIFGSIRSLNALDSHVELMPLRQLLEVMGIALRHVFPDANIKLWSGINSWKGGGWIGHNVNNMEFFFVIYLLDADILVFETFNHGIDPDKFNGQRGAIFEAYGGKKWMNELDTASPELDFFSKSSHEQIVILEEFLKKCMCIIGELT